MLLENGKTLLDEPFEPNYLNEAGEVVRRAAVRRNPLCIEGITAPSLEIQTMAVSLDPCAIKLIKSPLESVQFIAIEKDPHLVREINDPTVPIQLCAVHFDPRSIVGMTVRQDVFIAACKKDGSILGGIKDPEKRSFLEGEINQGECNG